jgi:hypothetical protein
MNVPGARVYSGTLTNVGTSYATLTINSPKSPPESGWIAQVIGSITGGPGTKMRIKIEDVPSTGNDLEYDDPDVPGDPIDAPLNFADPAVFYEGSKANTVEVATDVAGTDVKVELVIRHL